MTIKGRLSSTYPMLKVFSRDKFLSPVEKMAQKWRFMHKTGVKLNVWFCDPPKGTSSFCRMSSHSAIQQLAGDVYVFVLDS